MAKLPNIGMKASEVFDLPAEAIAGVPKLTITGMNKVLVEQHRGLEKYSTELVEIKGGRVLLKIRGEDLRIVSMTKSDLIISGQIFSAEFQ